MPELQLSIWMISNCSMTLMAVSYTHLDVYKRQAHANNLYTNWLNYYVYQSTPFDLYGTPDFSEI